VVVLTDTIAASGFNGAAPMPTARRGNPVVPKKVYNRALRVDMTLFICRF
jgi:hypothetical protein